MSHLTKLEEAIIFATEAHSGQVDKGGRPYILHPLRVMERVPDLHEAKIIAVLHDVVEDCGYTVFSIGARFGDDVATGVDGVSRRDGETYGEFITRAAALPVTALVKSYDIFDNLRPSRAFDLDPDERRGMQKRYLRSLPVLTGVVSWEDAWDWVKDHGGLDALYDKLLVTGRVLP